MAAEHDLSPAARRCRDERLPQLLLALRLRAVRRRRRRALVAAAVALGAAVAFGPWPWGSRLQRTPEAPSPVALQPRAVIVRDDPDVLARCRVTTQVRPEWFVDDAGLQALLHADGRADGLVRIAERVLVRAEVIDAYRIEP